MCRYSILIPRGKSWIAVHTLRTKCVKKYCATGSHIGLQCSFTLLICKRIKLRIPFFFTCKSAIYQIPCATNARQLCYYVPLQVVKIKWIGKKIFHSTDGLLFQNLTLPFFLVLIVQYYTRKEIDFMNKQLYTCNTNYVITKLIVYKLD